MKRYEVKHIALNWYGIWDNVKKEFVAETTSYGLDFYKELFDY